MMAVRGSRGGGNFNFSPDFKINVHTGCWCWAKATNGVYGVTCLNRKNILAHRFYYRAFNGPVPKGKFVCHSCDTPLCVNPDHLFIGSPSDNTLDMIQKGRSASGQKGLKTSDVKEAYQELKSQKKVAKLFGVTYQAIQRHLKKKGNL